MPGLDRSQRWEVLPADPALERSLSEELGVTPLVARVMCARGIKSAEQGRRFLSPSLERDWADPLLIPGMAAARDRVARALDDGEQIAIFGDFDVDGMSASCLLELSLREMGGRVAAFIPHRFGEGYGLSRQALGRVIEGCHPDLVVTVDNGIAAKEEVAWLLSEGIDVVVTDHHEPGGLVPEGVAVCDPKLEEGGASRELAGAGVALKLVQALGEARGQAGLWRRYTEVATLGTISDMMVLDAENRALVADGISHLRSTGRPGIQALAATAGVDLASITADELPFSLIPRLNAAGRMGTTDTAYQLLVTDDPGQAQVLAARLEQVNNDRREIEASLTEEAMAEAEASFYGQRCLVLGGEGWHEGVKGIVASRVTNRYHVPSILFSIKDGVARGSGRSVGSVDLFHAVEQCRDLLTRFGGHAGAVGVTLDADKLDAFRERLEQVMAALPAEQFVDKGEVAALVSLGEVTREGVDALEVLQPFGQGNKKPLLGATGVVMRNRSRVGAAANHLRFCATDGISSIQAIMFRTPDIERAADYDGAVDLVFEAVNETWQGRTKAKLMVKDILYRDGARDGAQDAEDQAPGEPGAMAGDGAPGAPAVPEEGQADGDAAERQAALDAAATRQRLARLSPDALADELRQRMIGDAGLLPAQREALDRLACGRSTLCVMATGRGKSLIFHIHAAREAILQGRASVFVYPLRALVSDQARHIADAFADVGMGVRVLTGETGQEAREEAFGGLAAGSVDVILTTPEFFAIHARKFAQAGRIGFVVIDEAHHAGRAKGGSRSAYLAFPEALASMGSPVVLALTATASTPVAREICRLFSIDDEDVVIDRSTRSNLCLRDCRDLRDRDAALVSIVAAGQKCVAYVNSREQSRSLCAMLRHAVPELAPKIGFYNAGLPRATRLAVERAFRAGELCCIVSTSAFGEGVNIADIRDVVLYHMPFGLTEFNQMSGRAGRDGRESRIWLLFGSRDAHINERVLSAAAPARDDLVCAWRALRSAQDSALAAGSDAITLSDEALAQQCAAIDARRPLDARAVSSAIGIFGELGFLEVSGFGDGRAIRLADHPEHMELSRSTRYAEGLRQREAFSDFRDWVLSCRPQEMLDRMDRPITPDFGSIVDG